MPSVLPRHVDCCVVSGGDDVIGRLLDRLGMGKQAVSVEVETRVGRLPHDLEPYDSTTFYSERDNLRCLLGFHDWRGGVINMRCGCTWNSCRRCGQPRALIDKQAAAFHEQEHVK